MDRTDAYFTQTIVGGPRELVLGVPTAGPSEPEWSFELPAPAEVSSPKPRFLGLLQGAFLPRRKVILLAAVSVSVFAVAAVALFQSGHVLRPDASAAAVVVPRAQTATTPLDADAGPSSAAAQEQPALPLQPAAQGSAGTATIAIQDTPYTPKPVVPPTVLPQAKESSGAQPKPAVNLPAAPPLATAAPRAPPPPTRTEASPEKERPLLIVDGTSRVEEKRGTSPPAVAAPSPLSPPIKAASGPGLLPPATAPAAAATPAAERPSTDSRVTVVDIAKDGSYVLISNPKTRLPERFTVGQRIFTGETIQKIDPATGSVQLDKRAVALQ